MKKCPECDTQNSDSAAYCSLCLTPFGEKPVEPPHRLDQLQSARESGANSESPLDNTSGQGSFLKAPDDIKKWNWGAFLLTWIWGIGNRTWQAFLVFIPLVGPIMPFVLGVKGSEWAWQNRRWASVEHFRQVQRQWAIGGAVVWVISAAIWLVMFSLIALPAYDSAKEAVACQRNISKATLAIEKYRANQGIYPATLGQLVDEGYLGEILMCPQDSSPGNEYSYDYTTGKITCPNDHPQSSSLESSSTEFP